MPRRSDEETRDGDLEAQGRSMADSTTAEMPAALRPLASLIAKSEKARQKLAPGSWQHSALRENLRALRLALALLSDGTDGAETVARDELREALRALASLRERSGNARAKFSPGTSQHTLLRNRTEALSVAEAIVTSALERANASRGADAREIHRASAPSVAGREETMNVHYLEIVTRDVDAVCASYASALGVRFSEPDAGLGGARTASLAGGGSIGVRAPLRESEHPVVRPYWLVTDIEASLAAAAGAGGEIAHPPLEIPGRGRFAIYLLGGNEHGLWQL